MSSPSSECLQCGTFITCRGFPREHSSIPLLVSSSFGTHCTAFTPPLVFRRIQQRYKIPGCSHSKDVGDGFTVLRKGPCGVFRCFLVTFKSQEGASTFVQSSQFSLKCCHFLSTQCFHNSLFVAQIRESLSFALSIWGSIQRLQINRLEPQDFKLAAQV